MCIELEALGLFVVLSLANETCGIEETFLNRNHPNFFRQVSNLYLGVSLFFPKFIPFFVSLFLLSFVKLQHNMSEQSEISVIIFSHSFIPRLHKFLVLQYGREFVHNFCLSDDLLLKWREIGERTVAKKKKYDLCVFKSFEPNIRILKK